MGSESTRQSSNFLYLIGVEEGDTTIAISGSTILERLIQRSRVNVAPLPSSRRNQSVQCAFATARRRAEDSQNNVEKGV